MAINDADTRPPVDLKHFFAPRRVALLGATEGNSRFGGKALGRMIDFGYQGTILPINPKFTELRGLPCYPSIADLPEVPDHIGVVVPANAVLGMLQECADAGIPFATVYSGGFAEAGTESGRAMQAEMTALARRTGLRVMGPNCNGMINFREPFAMTTTATIAGPRWPAGDVAVVSQSGGVGQVNTMWRCQQAGIGITYEVSCGNSADLDVIDFLEFMIDDDATKVVLMVVETIPSGARLAAAAARAAAAEKPIVMLKLGRTEAGGKAAASHTGAVMGSDDVCDAALRQFGIIRAMDTSELVDQAMLLRQRRWPRGTRIATTTASGGNAVLLVDLGSSLGLTWPQYEDSTREKLAEVLPALGSNGNPTDVTNVAIGRPGIYQACIQAIADDPNIDAVIPIFTISAKNDLEQATAVAGQIDKPMAILWTGGCNDDPNFTPQQVAATGVPVFRDTYACAKAMKAAAFYGAYLRDAKARGPRLQPGNIDKDAADRLLTSASGALTERASRDVLAAYGLPRMKEGLATTAEEAAALVLDFSGPAAMKIESADIPHKTEAQAIRLGVTGAQAAAMAFNEILEAARTYKSDARLNGVLVQEMAPAGVEMVVGIVSDPTFGPVVMVGAGGIHIEVLRDLSYRLAPVRPEEARAMLQELRSYPLLTGVRGEGPKDIDALVDAIVRLSWLGADFAGSIAELDVNPLRVCAAGEGIRIVDALIVKPEAE
jgi:acetate---CoA ligase (ADP-forming)